MFHRGAQRLKCALLEEVGKVLSLHSQMIEKYSKMLVNSPVLETRWHIYSSKKVQWSSFKMQSRLWLSIHLISAQGLTPGSFDHLLLSVE